MSVVWRFYFWTALSSCPGPQLPLSARRELRSTGAPTFRSIRRPSSSRCRTRTTRRRTPRTGCTTPRSTTGATTSTSAPPPGPSSSCPCGRGRRLERPSRPRPIPRGFVRARPSCVPRRPLPAADLQPQALAAVAAGAGQCRRPSCCAAPASTRPRSPRGYFFMLAAVLSRCRGAARAPRRRACSRGGSLALGLAVGSRPNMIFLDRRAVWAWLRARGPGAPGTADRCAGAGRRRAAGAVPVPPGDLQRRPLRVPHRVRHHLPARGPEHPHPRLLSLDRLLPGVWFYFLHRRTSVWISRSLPSAPRTPRRCRRRSIAAEPVAGLLPVTPLLLSRLRRARARLAAGARARRRASSWRWRPILRSSAAPGGGGPDLCWRRHRAIRGRFRDPVVVLATSSWLARGRARRVGAPGRLAAACRRDRVRCRLRLLRTGYYDGSAGRTIPASTAARGLPLASSRRSPRSCRGSPSCSRRRPRSPARRRARSRSPRPAPGPRR